MHTLKNHESNHDREQQHAAATRNEEGEVIESIQHGHQAKGTEEERISDVPPNGGYGWVCVAACATINA